MLAKCSVSTKCSKLVVSRSTAESSAKFFQNIAEKAASNITDDSISDGLKFCKQIRVLVMRMYGILPSRHLPTQS